VSSQAINQGVIGDLHALAPVLPEYECSICSRNMVDVVKTSCCGTRYCDDCEYICLPFFFIVKRLTGGLYT
jgi:hypothetical protein